ncbi:hypothetical protein ACO1O0_003573 [Amphichorda felina]
MSWGLFDILRAQRVEDARCRQREGISGLAAFEGAWKQFQTTDVHRRLQIPLGRIPVDFLGGKIKKIVGLHLGFFCWKDPRLKDIFVKSEAQRSAIYHNILLMIRRSIMRLGLVPPGHMCPIYVQDSLIREDEEHALSHHGIHVLSGAYGQQEGFTEIDDETMIVHFPKETGDPSLLGLIMDIATPAAIIWPNSICIQDKIKDHRTYLVRGKVVSGIHIKKLVMPSYSILPDYDRLANYWHNPVVTNDLDKVKGKEGIDPTILGPSPTIHVRQPPGNHGLLPDAPLAPRWDCEGDP